MAATTGKQLSVGIRHAQIYALNTNGRPAASSPTTPYTGLQVEGAKAFTLTVPEPRVITHSGDDRLLALDSLPSLEGSSGELRVAKDMYDVIALLTGTKMDTIKENVGVLWATDKQGFEPQVGLILFQQSLDAQQAGAYTGLRRWRAYMLSKAIIIPAPGNMDENPTEMLFRIRPQIVTSYLWGLPFTELANGATEAQVAERMFEGKPQLDSWLGDNSAVAFTLSRTAISTAKIACYVNGVLQTPLSTTTTVVTLSAAPATNADVNILYEY